MGDKLLWIMQCDGPLNTTTHRRMHALIAQIKKKRRETPLTYVNVVKEETAQPGSVFFRCPNCDGTHIIHNSSEGHYSCTDCGLVTAQSVISEEQEWREFEDDPKTKSRSRVGGAIDDDSIRLSTGKGRGKATMRVEATMKKQFESKARLQKAYAQIDDIAKKLRLVDKVKLRAKQMYKELMDTTAFNKRRPNACIGATLILAGKKESAPISEVLLTDTLNVTERELTRAQRSIRKSLEIRKAAQGATDRIQEVCDILQLSQDVARVAIYGAERVYDQGLAAEKLPTTVAGAVLVLALKAKDEFSAERVSQIATRLSVSQAVLASAIKEYAHYSKMLFPA